jgi:nuclear pore complex protein Nup93
LAHLVQERDVLQGEFQRKALQERCYATAYLNGGEGTDAVELRRMITAGGKTYLEEQSVFNITPSPVSQERD